MSPWCKWGIVGAVITGLILSALDIALAYRVEGPRAVILAGAIIAAVIGQLESMKKKKRPPQPPCPPFCPMRDIEHVHHWRD